MVDNAAHGRRFRPHQRGDSGHLNGYLARRVQAKLEAKILSLVYFHDQRLCVPDKALVFGFQTVLTRRDGGNRELSSRVADRAPLHAGFLARQGDGGLRHTRAAGVRNHPSHGARDGLGVRRPDQDGDGDRQSYVARKASVREFPLTGQQTPS